MSLSRLNTSSRNPWRALFANASAEARFRHVLEQMPGGALLVDPRSGQFLALNGRAAALTGWTRDELATRSLAEVVTAPDMLGQFYALSPGNTRYLPNLPLRTRAGKAIAVDARLSAFNDNGETVVLIAATLSDERLAQEHDKARQGFLLANLHGLLELFESPTGESAALAVARVAGMFQADSVSLWRRMPDTQGLQLGEQHNLPPNFPTAIGPSETQWLTQPLSWASAQRGEGFLPQAFRAAGWTHVLAHPLGEPPAISGAILIAYRPNNPPAAATAAFLEITARQLTHLDAQISRQAKLADAQRLASSLTHQLNAITGQIREGVVTLGRQGRVIDLSLAAARMLGYRSEDVIGLDFQDVLNADDGLVGAVHRLLGQAGPSGWSSEGQLHRRNGERFPALVQVRPLPQPGGGCVLILHDLTRERADEVEREQADHLAYIGQSTQSFAHEVRAPLNNISMGVQFLAARLPAEDALQAALAKIQAEAARLSALMNDMLAWAKPVDPKLVPGDLGALLKRLLTRWNAKFQQRNITLTFTPLPVCPPVLIDDPLLERVFVNIIENALQAMPAGGLLAISLNRADRGPQNQVLEVRLADSGPGISEEHRRRLFDPYFTTKADGTGLGLAICKRIVTVHHGAISVESFPGTGTVFIITLPIPESAPHVSEPSQ